MPGDDEGSVEALGRGRKIRAVVVSHVPPRTREIGYGCKDCEGTWVRVTAQRLVPASECPYCGGPARILRAEVWK